MQCINAQYDSEASMNFYKYTMGGGTDYVHYGVYTGPDDTLSSATHNTVLLLSELARRYVVQQQQTVGMEPLQIVALDVLNL
jgi:hypothetical protein